LLPIRGISRRRNRVSPGARVLGPADRQYQQISDEIRSAMRAIFPGGPVRTWPSFVGDSDIVHVSHPSIPRAFPQYGPGRKHTREIRLADWQLALTRAHPDVRYFFTNQSSDIRAIFAEHCALLDVRVTRPSERNLAISHRTSVAILEELVGAKQ
jgi:hypothetical protein